MKYTIPAFLIFVLSACNNNPTPDEPKADPAPIPIDTVKKVIVTAGPDSATFEKADTGLLLQVSKEILTAIKTKNYSKLADYVHPHLGVRLVPYAYIDSIRSKPISPADFIKLSRDQKPIAWGFTHEATGEPVVMTFDKYFSKFVYDVDFLNPERTSVNRMIGFGNSLNNLREIFPTYNFTEFHFSGFDPKFSGMDWRSLRLVFKMENGTPGLVAIIHDQWTI